jgi:hypothetical protein
MTLSYRKYWEKRLPTNNCIKTNRYYTIYLSVMKLEKETLRKNREEKILKRYKE